MNSYQKLGLISGQVLMGFLFGFGGVIVTALLGTLLEKLTGNHVADLGTTMLYLLCGGYVGMQIGVGYDGYKYLKGKGKLRDFKRFFGQSIVGFGLGLLLFYYTPLAFGLPMIGAIVGFDLGLIRRLNETEKGG